MASLSQILEETLTKRAKDYADEVHRPWAEATELRLNEMAQRLQAVEGNQDQLVRTLTERFEAERERTLQELAGRVETVKETLLRTVSEKIDELLEERRPHEDVGPTAKQVEEADRAKLSDAEAAEAAETRSPPMQPAARPSPVVQPAAAEVGRPHHDLPQALPPAVVELAAQHEDAAKGSSGIHYKVLMWSLLGLLAVVFLFVRALYAYPSLTIAMIGIVLMWLVFLSGEEPVIRLVTAAAASGGPIGRAVLGAVASALQAVQSMRSSHEKELKIKALLWDTCIFAVVCNQDVGVFSVFENYIRLTLAFVAGFCMIHTYMQASHYKQLAHGRGFAEAESSSTAVQEVIRELKQTVAVRLRYGSAWRQLRGQRRVPDIFEENEVKLNEILGAMTPSSEFSLELLLAQIKDKKEVDDLVELLCVTKVGQLSVVSKSMLLNILMRMRLSSCSGAEAAAESLLLSVEGHELSEVKSSQDCLGETNSLHKLVFQDIKQEEIRSNILNHILAAAMSQVAVRAMMGSLHFRELFREGQERGCLPSHLRFVHDVNEVSERCGSPSWRKIVTDIDDTLESSGARWPAGIDGRYPRHTPYPGVTTFFRELHGQRSNLDQLVALTARPRVMGDYMEQRVFKKFQRLIQDHGLHTMPALLTGSIEAGSKFVFSGSTEEGLRPLAEKKLERMREYIALYPEFRIIFIGDNGQADYAVGEMMCQEFPQNVEQVWIHEVQRRDQTWGLPQGGLPEGAPIEFVEDYIMAAVSAVKRSPPLLTPEGLARVVAAAVEDFKKITSWASDSCREAEVLRLNKSIVIARDLLHSMSITDEVELIDADLQRAASETHVAADGKGRSESPPTGPDDSNVDSTTGFSIFDRARGLASAMTTHKQHSPSEVAAAEPAQQQGGEAHDAPAVPGAAAPELPPTPAAASAGALAAAATQAAAATAPTSASPESGQSHGVSLLARAARGLVGGVSSASSQPPATPPAKPVPRAPETSEDPMPPVDLPPVAESGATSPRGTAAAPTAPAQEAAVAAPPAATPAVAAAATSAAASAGRSLLGGVLGSASRQPVPPPVEPPTEAPQTEAEPEGSQTDEAAAETDQH